MGFVLFFCMKQSRLENSGRVAYNGGAMIRSVISVCTLLFALWLMPAQYAVCRESEPNTQERVGAQLYRVTHEMWLLLAGVVDRKSADAAAERFRTLAEQSAKMSDQLFDDESKALDLESLDQDTYRIAEAFEDLSGEFESLCRTHCYGSPQLISAFLSAMRLGVFSDDSEEYLKMSSLRLSDREADAELVRLMALNGPDVELLQVLAHVVDEKEANAAVPRLRALVAQLRRVLPPLHLRACNFTDKYHPRLYEICRELEPLLWKIRTEIVRIVSLPGYDNDGFDDFSDALDAVYQCLGDTHAEFFDSVFDASFRSDLDEALHGDPPNS